MSPSDVSSFTEQPYFVDKKDMDPFDRTFYPAANLDEPSKGFLMDAKDSGSFLILLPL